MIYPYEQERYEKQTMIPRYGCYFLVMCAIPQFVYQTRFERSTVVDILEECKNTPRWDGKPCVGNSPEGNRFDVYLWDPGMVLNIACQKMNRKLHGWQVRDHEGWYKWADKKRYYYSFVARQIKRPGGFHYDLCDAALKLVWNPCERLSHPMTGRWIGFAVGEVK